MTDFDTDHKEEFKKKRADSPNEGTHWDDIFFEPITDFGTNFNSNEQNSIFISDEWDQYVEVKFGQKESSKEEGEVVSVIQVKASTDFSIGFNANGEAICGILNGKAVEKNNLGIISQALRKELFKFIDEISEKEKELINKFLMENRTSLSSQGLYKILGIACKGITDSHDKTIDTRIDQRKVPPNRINLATVQGEINEVTFSAVENPTKVLYDYRNNELSARILVTDKLASQIKDVTIGEEIETSIGLQDRPEIKSAFDTLKVIPLMEAEIRYKIPHQRTGTTFVIDPEADSYKTYLEGLVENSHIIIAYDSSGPIPILELSPSTFEDSMFSVNETLSIKIRDIDGSVLAMGGEIKKVTEHEKFSLICNPYKEIYISERVGNGGEDSDFVNYTMQLNNGSSGVIDMIYAHDCFEPVHISYTINETSSELNIIFEDNSEIKMDFTGSTGDSVRILKTSPDGAYDEVDPLNIFNEKTEFFKQLFKELLNKGGICQRMQAFFGPFMGIDPSSNLNSTDLIDNEPLEKWRWEHDFGPDPEGKIKDPRANIRIPGELLNNHEKLRGRFRSSADDPIAIKQGSFKLLQNIDFVVVGPAYVRDVLAGRIKGYITTRPTGMRQQMLAPVFQRGDKILYDGFVNYGPKDEIYNLKVDYPHWLLNGIISLENGKNPAQHQVFISENPIENSKIDCLHLQTEFGEEPNLVDRIGSLSEEETLSAVQKLFKNIFNNKYFGFPLGLSHFSDGVSYKMNDLEKLAKQRRVYAPRDPSKLIEIFENWYR